MSYCYQATFYSSENGDIPAKTAALKNVMYQMLNGEKMPSILMIIIRFVLPLQDHTIKKLLLIFWEVVPKTNADGKLLHEMILGKALLIEINFDCKHLQQQVENLVAPSCKSGWSY